MGKAKIILTILIILALACFTIAGFLTTNSLDSRLQKLEGQTLILEGKRERLEKEQLNLRNLQAEIKQQIYLNSKLEQELILKNIAELQKTVSAESGSNSAADIAALEQQILEQQKLADAQRLAQAAIKTTTTPKVTRAS